MLEAAIAKKARWHDGERLGRYELKKKLGAGAFAEVWLADEVGELGFRKKVALKLLKSSDDEERVEELLSEARLVAVLSHPNIVGITRIEPEPVFHMAIEYVDGGTVLELIERMTASELVMPPSVVLKVGLDVARALEVAHHHIGQDGKPRPIVHRDLKPANILLARSGFAKVADFGLAKAVGDATATATGMLKGTPAYVAPEIWKGQREFGPPIDLFALGCILYEMAVGHRLMLGSTIPEIFAKASMGKAEEEANELAEWCPPLVPIVRRLLERDPADRYEDTRPLIRDLEQAEMLIARGADLETFLTLLEQVSPVDDGEPPPLSGSIRLPTKTDPVWAAFLKETTGTDVEVVSQPAMTAESALAAAAKANAAQQIKGRKSGKTTTRSGKTGQVKRPSSKTTRVRRPSSKTTQVRTVGADKKKTSPLLLVLFAVIGVLLVMITMLALFSEPDEAPVLPPVTAARPGVGLPADLAVANTVTRPEPTTAARPVPTPAVRPPAQDPEPETAAEAPTPEPTPEEVVTPEPTPKPAAPTTGCVQLASRPSGGVVWLNGTQRSSRALSNPRRGVRLKPGKHTVEMGQGSSASVKTTVTVRAGDSTKVTCFLTGSANCSIGSGDNGACD